MKIKKCYQIVHGFQIAIYQIASCIPKYKKSKLSGTKLYGCQITIYQIVSYQNIKKPNCQLINCMLARFSVTKLHGCHMPNFCQLPKYKEAKLSVT